MTSLSSSLAQIVRRVSVLLLVAPQFACDGTPPPADVTVTTDGATTDTAVLDGRPDAPVPDGASIIDGGEDAAPDAASPPDAPVIMDSSIDAAPITPGAPFACLNITCRTNAEFCYLEPRFGGDVQPDAPQPMRTPDWYTPRCITITPSCGPVPTCACYRPADPGFFGTGRCEEMAPGQILLEGTTGGRTTEGLAHATPGAKGSSLVSAWLSSVATLEAEAVLAFERLSRELSSHGAPDELVARMKRAAGEERTHATLLGALAREHGAAPAVAVAASHEVRPLFSIAVENAAEGLGRELYGALVAHWQAAHAPTDRLRALFARIAEDESRHAEDSVALDAWARPRLASHEHALLDRARERALEALLAAPDTQSPELTAALGLPDARVRAALVRALRETPSFSLAH